MIQLKINEGIIKIVSLKIEWIRTYLMKEKSIENSDKIRVNNWSFYSFILIFNYSPIIELINNSITINEWPIELYYKSKYSVFLSELWSYKKYSIQFTSMIIVRKVRSTLIDVYENVDIKSLHCLLKTSF